MGNNHYIDKVEEVVKKLLPKFIEKYESQYGFDLPKFNIIEIDGYVQNIWKIFDGSETTPIFNFINVKVEIETKDGRIGRVKKLINSLVEKTLDSLGYEFNEIYVQFIKTSDFEQEKIDKVRSTIHNLLLSNRHFKGWYTMPYTDNDDKVDWHVSVYPNTIDITQAKPNPLNDGTCIYDVKIVLIPDKILVGFEDTNEWEKVDKINYLPERSLDEIQDKITNLLSDFMPNICDVEIEYTTLKNMFN